MRMVNLIDLIDKQILNVIEVMLDDIPRCSQVYSQVLLRMAPFRALMPIPAQSSLHSLASHEQAFLLHHVSKHSSHPCYLLPCGPVPRPLKLVIQEEEKEGFCFTEFPTP